MKRTPELGAGFHALYQGTLISNTGDGIRLAAVPLLAASLTSSPVLIGAVTAAQYLPWLTFAPLGGALVDRWDRRQIVLVNQAWRGLIALALGLLVASDQAEIWHVCVVAFAITAGEILVDPSTVALVPTLVDDADLNRANSKISSAEIITNDFAGGPVGAALFSVAPWLPFLTDGFSYLGSLLPFRRLPQTSPAVDASAGPAAGQKTSVLQEAAEGFRWLRRHEVLGPLTLGYVVYFFGLATSLALLVVLVKSGLGGSSAAFGLILAIGAIGAFLGTFLGGPLVDRVGIRWSLVATVALQGLTVLVASQAGSIAVLAIAWFLNGLPAGAQRPISRTLQQRLTPNELLGRINVTSRIFTRGVIVAGALLAGTLADQQGIRAAFVAAAIVQLLAALVTWWALGRGELPDS